MNTTKRKFALALAYLLAVASIAKAQPGTLEMTQTGSSNTVAGPSTAPVSVIFSHDLTNATAGTIFADQNVTPALTVTASLGNQQYTNTYGNISTGIAFGAANSGSTGGNIQQATPVPVYNALGATLNLPPQNGMFVSSPTGTIVSNYQAGGRGVGLDVEATQGGHDSNGADDYNFGIAVFTNVEPLYSANADKAGRFYYGTLTLTFNRPVLNPVVHIGGMGGSYSYLPNTPGAVPLISYFSTEMELQNTGVTSTFMSGNSNFNVSGNNILNSNPSPNAGSYDDGSVQNGFLLYGAATGSVRVNGTVTQLVYKVYVKGSANSNFNFSKNMSAISGATRSPLNGDLFYVAVSLDNPLQQISGNVFDDADGLTDNNVNKSAGVANIKTNAGGTIYANLLNAAGLVVSSMAVTAEGSFLFNNVPTGTYTVQLTTNTSNGTYAAPVAAPLTVLPAGWVNTGEFIGSGVGSDGTINGKSGNVTVVVSDIKTEVNFGIERLPDSQNFSYFLNPAPVIHQVLPLTGLRSPLAGSDPEELPTTTKLYGRNLMIVTVPTNTVLKYNGTTVTPNFLITNYDTTKLSIVFDINTATPSTSFTYAYVDAAGKQDPTPATYTITWPPVILAVTLSEFTAVASDCSANIGWTITGELNVDRYETEVSTNQRDFAKFATIAPRGTSSISETYTTPYKLEGGTVYYFRLKIVNFDGTVSYSAIRPLSCGGKLMITIAPNPVTDQININGMNTGKNTVAVFSNDGKLVKQEIINGTSGSVNVSQYTPGMYVVRIAAADGTIFTGKIIKK